MRPAPRLALALTLVAGAACKCPAPKQAPDAGPGAERSLPDESVRPVYEGKAPADPGAARLCAALFELPEQRKAECCKGRPGSSLAPECTRVLSLALQAGAVRLAGARVDACVGALQAARAGCDWVGALELPRPAECGEGLWQGALPAGANCRSSLECAAPLRCQGASPTTRGVCAPSRPEGAACNTGVDVAAAYAGFDLDLTRPECQGYCDHHRCHATLPLGASCKTSLQCGREAHCHQGACAIGASVAPGAACTGPECPAGQRCLGGVCAPPRPAGAACSGPFDCQGACLSGPDGGVCGMRCR